MIYFLANKNYDVVKIGYTKSHKTLNQRMLLLQTGCPYVLSILKVIEGTQQDEFALHKLFKSAKTNKTNKKNEWYFLSKVNLDEGYLRQEINKEIEKNKEIEISREKNKNKFTINVIQDDITKKQTVCKSFICIKNHVEKCMVDYGFFTNDLVGFGTGSYCAKAPEPLLGISKRQYTRIIPKIFNRHKAHRLYIDGRCNVKVWGNKHAAIDFFKKSEAA